MEEKPIFIIIGVLTVLIGLVPLLNVMNTMGEATSKNHDHQQLERLVGGVNDECGGRSGFIEIELQAGRIEGDGDSVTLEVADESTTMGTDCEVDFVNGTIETGDTTVTFDEVKEDESDDEGIVEVIQN